MGRLLFMEFGTHLTYNDKTGIALLTASVSLSWSGDLTTALAANASSPVSEISSSWNRNNKLSNATRLTVLLLAKGALLEAQNKEIKTTFPQRSLLWAEQNTTNGRSKCEDFQMATLASKSSVGWRSCSLKIIPALPQNWINSNNKTQVIPRQFQFKSWQFCFPCHVIPKSIIGLKDYSRAQAKNLQLLLMCYSKLLLKFSLKCKAAGMWLLEKC